MNKTRILGPFFYYPKYLEFTQIGKYEILFYNKTLLV